MYKKFIENMISKELFERRYSVVKFEELKSTSDTQVFYTAKCINLANDKAEYEYIKGNFSVYNGFEIWESRLTA